MSKTIQISLIAMFALSIPACLFTGWLLAIVLLFIGITQYVGSLIEVFRNGKKSKFLWHFVWSSIILMILSKLYITDGGSTLFGIAAAIGIICLPIYYWVLIFDSDWENENG